MTERNTIGGFTAAVLSPFIEVAGGGDKITRYGMAEILNYIFDGTTLKR